MKVKHFMEKTICEKVCLTIYRPDSTLHNMVIVKEDDIYKKYENDEVLLITTTYYPDCMLNIVIESGNK